jgi:glutaredoxin
MARNLVTRSGIILTILLWHLMAATATEQQTYRWIDKSGQVHYSDQPPLPSEVGSIEEKRLSGSVIETSGPGYATRTAAANFPVTLYTATDCQSDCKQARDFLAQRHIPYTEKVIKSSEDAEAYKKVAGSSDVFVPSLSVGSQFQRGFLDSAWNAALNNAGYPGSH